MRILVITNRYPNKHKLYAGKFVERHVQLHRQMGLEVTVLTPSDSRTGWRSFGKYIDLCWRTLWYGLRADFDVVHAHWAFPAGGLGAVIGRLRNKPFILTSHGAFTERLEERSPIVRWLVKWILQQANRIIVVGETQRESVARIANIPPSSIAVIGMGVWLPQSPPNQIEARARLHLPFEQPILIFIGNLSAEKGADVLLRAVCHVAYEDLCVYIGGQGPEQAALRQLADKRATFLGAVPPDDVYMWLAAADVCIVPSRVESFGLVALEAMSVGTAVVAAAVGGLAENIRHDENGLLFSAEDDEALATCLLDVLADAELRERLAANGRRTAVQFDMRQQAAKVAAIYRELKT